MNCRHCCKPLQNVFLDLGFAPPSNAYLTSDDLSAPELYFPLKVYVCDHCWLVQTEDYAHFDELFTKDYAYFSSVSRTWLDHAESYSRMIIQRLDLNVESHVTEIASNDGYLLKNFVQANIPCLGIEPTASTAAVAEALGIPVLREFFGEDLAQKLSKENKKADLIIGNNVYAHVPDINNFTAGLKTLLKPEGTITLEFPHLMRLIEKNQFDTVYHEHFSYHSLYTVSLIFQSVGLRVWDVEELSTHGGSLRVYGCHSDDTRTTTQAVTELLGKETQSGLHEITTYSSFQKRADQVKNDFLAFLLEQKRGGKTVAAYGAAAKGNTLMNYAGIKPDLLPFVCDAASSKQGKYLPGTHIPIVEPDILRKMQPDYLLILPWNIADEVMKQNNYIREWGGKFVTAVPHMKIY